MAGRRLLFASVCALAALALSAGASAGPSKHRPSPPVPLQPGGATSRPAPDPAARHGHIGGIVPSRRAVSRFAGLGSGNLVYNGGPVMHTSTTYAIYWVPPGYSVDANYESVINGYFQNVAAASGAISNVYAMGTEYYDTNGAIAYDATFGGSVVDTDAFPSAGCSDSGLPLCLTDAQVQAEIDKVVAQQGWTGGLNHQFFIFTPKTVGSCFDSGSSECAYSNYCAYHGYFSSTLGNGTVIYANHPYTASSATPGGCDSGEHPNNDDADPTINVISHEHNEAITDPELNAWYDSMGYEDGDKCAWIFGDALDGSGGTGAAYNQVIGTGHYYLQEEWSNGTVDPTSQQPGTCLQRYAPSVTLAGTGGGTVTSGDGNVTCTANPCDLTGEIGNSVTLTATADDGSTFMGWTGACTGDGGCTVDVTAATSVSARFDAPGLPSGWADAEVAPPDGVNPFPNNSSPDYSFFDLAQSADGTERAKTIYHPPATGFCYYDTSDTGGVFLERNTGSGWVADGTIHAPSLGTDIAKNWLNCGSFGSITQLSDDGSTLLLSQDMSAVSNGALSYRCAVLVYKRGDSGWTADGTLYPPGVDASGTPTWDGCGYFGIGASLSADGTRIAVLSFEHVDVFVRGDSGWSEEQRLDVPEADSGCGHTIGPAMLTMSADGSHVFVGDPNCDGTAGDAGRAYAYDRSGSTWTLTQTFDPPDPVFQGEFGSTMALSADGSTAVISANNASDRPFEGGAAWVYEHDDSGWHERAELAPTTAESQSGFTCSTVLRGGTRILCGAFDGVGYDNRQGSVYVFDRGEGWGSSGAPLRLYAEHGHSSDVLGRTGEYGWRAYGTTEDALLAPIASQNVPLYGHDLLGYEFDGPAAAPAPVIASFAPSSGVAGDSVIITGTSFTDAYAVKFNGVEAASFTVDSDTQITAVVPAGATSGTITVATPSGADESVDTFTALAVSSFAPTSGGAGTSVTIHGSGFTDASAVSFHGTPAASFTVDSDAQITAVAPAGGTSGAISVTAPPGTAVSASSFAYAPPPKITLLSPKSAAAGQVVTISGLHLDGATAVKFHGFDAAHYDVVGLTKITATVPDDATVGSVTVTTPGGTASSGTVLFRPLPVVASFSPPAGPAGTRVSIAGTNLSGATSVTFGGVKATVFTVDSATHITAQVPAGAKTGTLRVVTPAGSATSAHRFVVVAAPRPRPAR